MSQVLRGITKNVISDDKLLVGIETSDDAAVYDLGNDNLLITTLDFFTPIVDDPYTFGLIGAANSLSDVYAMGGYPKMAMNIVCFPNCLNPSILQEILRGGFDKMMEAECLCVGGHTVQDDEPKYGLSVSGFCHRKDLLRNSSANEGDLIIMTKPIGTGVLTTAIKAGFAKQDEIDEVVKSMSTLNAFGLKAIEQGGGATAATDITGFGLAGHLIEMLDGADLSCDLYTDKLVAIKSAHDYAQMGLVPKGTYDNKKYFSNRYESMHNDFIDDLVFDPQTSGGLLITADEKRANKIMQALRDSEYPGAIIGEVTKKREKRLYVK